MREQALRRNAALRRVLSYVLISIGAFFMVGPMIWCLSSSLATLKEIYNQPPPFFKLPLQFYNYVRVWSEMDFPTYSVNTMIITLLCIIGTVFSSAFAGFGLARYKFPGANLIFFCALGTMMIPAQTLIIPQYSMWMKLRMLDTFIPLVVPAFFGGAFGIFLMRQAFMSIPSELYEAAMADGCPPLRIFSQIYLPLVSPTIAALSVFTFVSEWNAVFRPLIFLSSRKNYTLSLGMMYMRGEYAHNTELLMAGTIIMIIPVLIVYLCAQKYFVQGIASAGLKG